MEMENVVRREGYESIKLEWETNPEVPYEGTLYFVGERGTEVGFAVDRVSPEIFNNFEDLVKEMQNESGRSREEMKRKQLELVYVWLLKGIGSEGMTSAKMANLVSERWKALDSELGYMMVTVINWLFMNAQYDENFNLV